MSSERIDYGHDKGKSRWKGQNDSCYILKFMSIKWEQFILVALQYGDAFPAKKKKKDVIKTFEEAGHWYASKHYFTLFQTLFYFKKKKKK